MKAILLVSAVLSLAAGSALAADNPWNGTWKIDPAQGHFTGYSFTFSQGPGNLLHFSDGSAVEYDFGIGGKEYKTWSNRTTIWTAVGNNAWDTVNRADGKVLVTSHRQLSADGKTLTITLAGTRPDGSALRETEVYSRVSGAGGLVGTWRSVKVSGPDGPQEFVITSPAPGVLHYEVPDMKASADGRTDGSDSPLIGPDVPPGSTIAFKALSPTKMSYVMKINGKTDSLGEQTLAADGRSFSDVSWIPGKEAERTTAVFVKQ